MPGFHALSAAWFFALLVPLVLLYFLKLRRPRTPVSSLFLWRRVLDDDRVNAPFQRFKRSLLFWLQLALLCLLVLAAMQPFLGGGDDAGGRLPILIDCSASMAALDEAGGTSRLAEAKKRARRLIDELDSGQAASIIAFSGRARQVTGFTRDRRRLFDAIDGLAVDDEAGRVEGALRLAEATVKTAPFERVLLITDGNMDRSVDFSLPFELTMETLPTGGRNVGISAFRGRQVAQAGWEVFVSVTATLGYTGTVVVRLSAGGSEIGQQSVSFRQDASKRVVFRVDVEDDVELEASIVPDAFDSLPSDNRAWLALRKPRPLRVAVGAGLGVFTSALEGLDGVELNGEAPPDVSIHTGSAADGAVVELAVAALPADVGELFDEKSAEDVVVDWDRASPLLVHVNLADVAAFGERAWRAGCGVKDLEARGYRVVVHGNRAPLVIRRDQTDSVRYDLLFDPARSTLPYRMGFPVLVMNVVRMARARAGLLDAESAATGVLPAIRAAAGSECRVAGPNGLGIRRPASSDGLLSGIPAPHVGEYVVRGDGILTTVRCSLLCADESRLARVDKLEFNERLTVTGSLPRPTERPLWPWVALVAFVVLLVEWWFYYRRGVAPA